MSAEEEIDSEENLNPKDRGLGRGLGALFGDEEEDVYPQFDPAEGAPDSARKTLGTEQLFPCADQPRRYFDEDALKELSDSIVEHGLLQPILVRPDKTRPDMYEIVAGERRWRAAQKAQLHQVPVIIKELDDSDAFQIALIENLQREDLSPIEEAKGYNRLVEDFGQTHEAIGKALGKSRSHIANMIRLLALNDTVQMMLTVGDISTGHARALLGTDNQETLAMVVIRDNLSVRETEELVASEEGREIKHRAAPKKKVGFAEKDADTLALEKEVSDQLGMNVLIDMKNAHKGSMTISFTSLDQLDDVLQRLAQTPKY